MTRNIFAITVAGLIIAAISGGSQAAPIAPLGVHCRRCWYGPRGHVHCT
jgi:hypothetical protein